MGDFRYLRSSGLWSFPGRGAGLLTDQHIDNSSGVNGAP
jgi:hypothetical protein